MIHAQMLDILCRLARQAGEEILSIYESNVQSWQKSDKSPLTEADLRADVVIREGLEAAFPNVYILSEESKSEGALPSLEGGLFLVDPLDGTKEFLKRNGEFTVNIAYVEDGQVLMGVVFAPVLNELYFAAQGMGAWCQRKDKPPVRLSTAKYSQGDSLKVVASRSHGSEALQQWLSGLSVPYESVAIGSSLKLCYVAQGLAHVYPRLGPTSQWDTAAAQCVVEQAGGAVMTLRGEPLCYGLQRPILNPEFLAVSESVQALLGVR